MKQAYSGDGIEISVRFYSDPGDILVQPQTVHWRVDVPDSERTVIDWTAGTITATYSDLGTLADAYVQIEVPGSANVVKATEKRRIRVVADKDTPRQVSEDFFYTAKP